MLSGQKSSSCQIFYLTWKVLFCAGNVDGCSYNKTVYENTDIDRCPEKSWLAVLFFAVYMIMTNILLLNLLIAMFRWEHVWRGCTCLLCAFLRERCKCIFSASCFLVTINDSFAVTRRPHIVLFVLDCNVQILSSTHIVATRSNAFRKTQRRCGASTATTSSTSTSTARRWQRLSSSSVTWPAPLPSSSGGAAASRNGTGQFSVSSAFQHSSKAKQCEAAWKFTSENWLRGQGIVIRRCL